MSPMKTTALAVLIVTLGLIASVRFGNAGMDGWRTLNADPLAVRVELKGQRQQ